MSLSGQPAVKTIPTPFLGVGSSFRWAKVKEKAQLPCAIILVMGTLIVSYGTLQQKGKLVRRT